VFALRSSTTRQQRTARAEENGDREAAGPPWLAARQTWVGSLDRSSLPVVQLRQAARSLRTWRNDGTVNRCVRAEHRLWSRDGENTTSTRPPAVTGADDRGGAQWPLDGLRWSIAIHSQLPLHIPRAQKPRRRVIELSPLLPAIFSSMSVERRLRAETCDMNDPDSQPAGRILRRYATADGTDHRSRTRDRAPGYAASGSVGVGRRYPSVHHAPPTSVRSKRGAR
jgi:hypothetical protein